MNDIAPLTPLSPADFASDQEVRWCPGCGDYSILKAVQRVTMSPRRSTRSSACLCRRSGDRHRDRGVLLL